jgi:crotonobetainyl-CoA:carnitine CoA-transferase CaiB-like acyl-CoA transferase
VGGAHHAPGAAAPEIGAHTAAVLAEIGVPAEEIAALAAAGAVGPPSLAEAAARPGPDA